MKKQPYPVVDLTGGINVSKDPYFILDKENPSLINARLYNGLLRKDVGTLAFSDDLPLDGTPMFIDTFYTQDGSEYLLIVTTSWIYEYNSNTDVFTKRNPAGTDVVTTGATLTFEDDDNTITRAAGSWVTDGFAEGDDILTTSSNNPGPFVITGISATVLTVTGTMVDEGPLVVTTVAKMYELTGDEDYPFSSATMLTSAGDDVYFLTNGADLVMRWEGSGAFTQVASTYAKRLAVFKDRLILGHTIESGTSCPRRVRWSVLADPDDFSGTGSGFIELADTPDWVVALIVFKDKMFVFKERSIWEFTYTGETTYFTPMLVIDGVGTVAPNSALSLGEEIVFFGNDNVYSYDGLSLTAIADQLFPMLYDTEQKIVQSSLLKRSYGIYVEELEEYWLTLPTIGDYANTLFKYNFIYKSWSLKYTEATTLGYYSVVDQPTWEELTGAWSAQTWIWMEKALPIGAPTTLIGTPDGYIWEDDRLTRSTERMLVETKDWMFAHAQRWVEFRVVAKGGEFTLRYSVDRGVTWSEAMTCVTSEEFDTYVLFINETSESIRCRIESYAEDLTIKWIEPWYLPRQRVKSKTSAV